MHRDSDNKKTHSVHTLLINHNMCKKTDEPKKYHCLNPEALSTLRCWEENVSGYYRNLGSLRAGTRHHGEFSVMGTPSFQPFLKSYWLTPVKWLANCHEVCTSHANTDKLRGSIKCGARDNYVRIGYWTLLSWSCSEHGDLRDVSFPLSGNRGYDSNRRRSLSSFYETSRRILRYGNDIQSRRERGYEQPVQVTL